jgi:hypothetical protein
MTSTMQVLSDADLDAVTGGAGLRIHIGKIGPIDIGSVTTGTIKTGAALGKNGNSSVMIEAAGLTL